MSTPRALVGQLIRSGAARSPATAPSRDQPRRRTGVVQAVWAPVLVLIACTVIAWVRTSTTATSIVYAEDGRIFLGDQENAGFWQSLFAPYTGYLQFLPRLMVGVVRVVAPIGAYPAAVAAACAVVVGAVAAAVFVWSAAVSPWLPFRVTIALITVLAPVASIEVAGDVANIHWYALWGGFWLLLHQPRSRLAAIGLAMIAAVFALTEIQTALLLPLALLRLQSRRDWIVRGGLLLGLVLQFAGLVHSPRAVVGAHPPVVSVVAGWFVAVPTAVFRIPDATRGTIASLGLLVGLAAVLPPLAALVYVLIRGDRVSRTTAIGLAAMALLVWFAAVWANTVDTGGVGFDVLRARPEEFIRTWYSRIAPVPSRYSLVPSMSLAALPVVASAVWRARRRAAGARVQRRAVVVPVLTVLVLGASFVPVYSTRDGGPSWPAEVQSARERCDGGAGMVTLRTAPAGWSVDLPCTVLR